MDWPIPFVFAHRGDSANAPENTLAAFELAVKQGAAGIELDAKLTSDGHVVVIHDATVDRTTDGKGKVSQMPLAELRDLDAGLGFSGKFHREKIPMLSEVFEAVGKKTKINVELTNYSTPLDFLVPNVVFLVRKHGLEEHVLLSSFLPHNLLKAARFLAGVPCGLLVWPGWMGWWARTFGFRKDVYQALHPYIGDVDTRLVDRVHASGKRVHVWTVNSEVEIKHMIEIGADGIFTDNPELAVRLLRKA